MARGLRATEGGMGQLVRLGWFLTLLAATACGSDSSGGAGGSTSGGASGSAGSASGGGAGSGGASGGSGGASGGSSGATGGSGGGAAGDGGTCTPTTSAIQCGAGTACDAKSQICCGGPADGTCYAPTAFCGLGGGIRMKCDDPSDCAAGEICCVAEVPNAGNDAPYETHCVKPKTFQEGGDVFGCGTTGGGFPWPRLCACSSDCDVGSCKPGAVYVPVVGTSFMRCE